MITMLIMISTLLALSAPAGANAAASISHNGQTILGGQHVFKQKPLQDDSGIIDMSPPTKQVAIIGAGAAGSSTAYFLRRYADEAGIPVDITVLEQNDYIGGRSTTVCAFEDGSYASQHDHPSHYCIPIELGASIYVSANYILSNAVRDFDLDPETTSQRRIVNDDEDETIGIYDGKRFVFTQTTKVGRVQSWWNTVKILWKYGISPYRTMKLMESTVTRFQTLYDPPFWPWKRGLDVAANEAGLFNETGVTGLDYLRNRGVSNRFANDIVQASTRVNYAQNLDSIHGLETMVCMATEGAKSVPGGNWQIFASMLNASKADVYLKSKVDEIEIGDPNKGLRISSADIEIRDYGLDALILAAPYHQAGIKFTPPPTHVPDDIEYVNLHVTLFSSPHRLSPKAFNLGEDEATPDVILTTLPSGDAVAGTHGGAGPAGFFSISKLRAAINPNFEPPRKEYIYKIFSPEAVSESFLRRILGLHDDQISSVPTNTGKGIPKTDVFWIYRKVWQSYPYLPPRRTFEPLQLDKNIWYTSGIESFISTMETSALSGQNVARLIVDGWLEDAR